ncbi:MAG: hypothetical protein FD168_1153 [Desulfobulbaceae bacterium]|jgi:hypothetical protein|nr:MAG: hypothetical protein FD168_1153 [Desulfobulbaceae bacterium]
MSFFGRKSHEIAAPAMQFKAIQAARDDFPEIAVRYK